MIIVSGIYIILNLKNGKIYLGSAKNIKERWQEHRRLLNKDCHTNIHLQRAWNKSGSKSFKFKVLEYCFPDQLEDREQHFIDIYKPMGICYNIANDVKAPMRGRHLSDEHKAKISAFHKGKIVTEETREKLRAATTGQKHSLETREKLSVISKARHRQSPSEETRHKISESEKGKIVSEETRRKLSESHKGHIPWNKGKSKKKSDDDDEPNI